MPVRSLRSTPIFAWIPPQSFPSYSLTVTRADATVDDVTLKLAMLEITDGDTDTIGSFEFTIYDPDQNYANVWNGNEAVKFYSDYAASATTLRFRGRVEKVSYNNNKLTVTGRGESARFMDVTVTRQYTNEYAEDIVIDLVQRYSDGITTTYIGSNTTSLTVNWVQKPWWDCIKEVCKATGYAFYVDANLNARFFERGSVNNETDAMVHTHNLMDVGEFAYDTSQIKNRVIVYGATIDGVQVLATAEDTDSQSSYGVKEEVINDTNITTETQAQELADAELEDLKNPPLTGEMTSILLATIQPGEKLRLSSPDNNIQPDFYEVITYSHRIDLEQGRFETVALINKEPSKISHVFKDILERNYKTQDTSLNPHEMRYSYNFLFNEDSGQHSSTQITQGVLKLSSGSSGTWISAPRYLSSDVTQVYLKAIGTKVTGATFYVSGDNGLNWENITSGESPITLSTSSGNVIKIKIDLSDSTTEIDSLSVLYSI